MAKKTKAPVHSEEHMLREQGVAPVWQPQINQEWKYGVYQQTVRLPSVDTRQPLVKSEAAAEGPQECSPSMFNAKPPITTLFTSAGITTTTTTTLPSPSPSHSQTKVNLPSIQHEQPSSKSHLAVKPKKPHPILHTRGRYGHLKLSSRKPHEHAVTKVSKTHLSRASQGRNNPRNELMRQARLRYEQEKLAILQQAQQQDVDSPVDNPKITSIPSRVGRTSPVEGVNPIQRPNLLPRHSLRQQPAQVANDERPSHPLETPKAMRGLRAPAGKNNHTYPRPSSSARRLDGSPHQQQQLSHPTVRRQDGWNTWIELRVRVFGLPATITTRELWECFSNEGSVDVIEIFEDSKGTREGKASIRYRPPPVRPFWQIEGYPVKLGSGVTVFARLELEPQKRSFFVPSPVRPQLIKFPEFMVGNTFEECDES